MTDDITIEEVRPSVRSFAISMEERLQKKEWKGGWDEQSRRELYDQLILEAMSLLSSIQNRDKDRIMRKCSDVANYAMMIFDNERNKIEDNKEN